jgi:hypothetical protein
MGGLALSASKWTWRDLLIMGLTRRNRSSKAAHLGVLGLLVLMLAACSAPNLDETVAGEPAGSIRERIVDHGDWGETLSAEQLDQLAGFIAEHAGSADVGRAAAAPGWTIWKTSNCGECHALAAGSGD